jgi:hypothetical protein
MVEQKQGLTTAAKPESDQDDRKESPRWEFARGMIPSPARSEKS